MTKIVSAIIFLAMIANFIKPFGVPGFRKRTDGWKLALVAFAILAITVVVRPEG